MQDLAIEDLIDAGRDLRLDQAYPEFYRAQHGGNAALPSPLDTTTLFNSLAKRLIEGQDGRLADPGSVDIATGQGVQQLFNLVQGAPPSPPPAQEVQPRNFVHRAHQPCLLRDCGSSPRGAMLDALARRTPPSGSCAEAGRHSAELQDARTKAQTPQAGRAADASLAGDLSDGVPPCGHQRC